MAINEELTERQDRAIAALLSEPTIKAAAEKARVGERTLHTWLLEPAFDGAYRKARREAVRQAIARLQQTSSDAVQVLISIMNDTTKHPSSRIAAASKVLDLAIRAIEIDDLEARIAALESRGA